MALQDLTMMPSSRLGCPLSLKTPNMGNTGLTLEGVRLSQYWQRTGYPHLPCSLTEPSSVYKLSHLLSVQIPMGSTSLYPKFRACGVYPCSDESILTVTWEVID